MTVGKKPPVLDCVEGYVFARGPPRFLLLKRSPARGGFWQSVSGRVETWDPSFRDAVVREVREETGFTDLRSVDDLGWGLEFPGPVSGRPLRSHCFSVEVPSPRPPRLSDEHVEHRWCTTGEALSLLYWPDNREALRRLLQKRGL